MSKTVFVLTIGRDNDERCVIGVYATEERALTAARSQATWPENPHWQIDEYDLDASDFGRPVVWTEYDPAQRRMSEKRQKEIP